MPFVVNIPPLNGEVEAGIAAGIDPSLLAEHFLPIIKDTTEEKIRQYAAIWAYTQIGKTVGQRRFAAVAAATAVDAGLICTLTTSSIPDGDWKYVTTFEEIEENKYTDLKEKVADIFSPSSQQAAITMMVAMKANYWQTNHNTGQGALSGYVLKVFKAVLSARPIFNAADGPDEGWITTLHTIAHWVSTRCVLDNAGIPGILKGTPALSTGSKGWSLSADAALRFSGFPAGTHKLAIAHAGCKRLILSPLINFCPRASEFADIPVHYKSVKAKRAAYLTGQPRADYSDSTMESRLGRIGAFMNIVYAANTMNKSPHLDKARVASYEDSDDTWVGTLQSYVSSQARRKGLDTLAIESGDISQAEIQKLVTDFQG